MLTRVNLPKPASRWLFLVLQINRAGLGKLLI